MILGFFCLFSAGCASLHPTHPSKISLNHPGNPPEFILKIEPGAKIDILVDSEPAFSKENLVVEADGSIVYPPLGKIAVSNFTKKTLKEYLVKRLSEDFFHNPIVSVNIKSNAKIYVLGEVNQPGLIEIEHPITVLEAIKLAGSFSSRSERDTIKIVRQTEEGEEIKTIRLKKIGFNWIKNENIYIGPGDLVMVN